MEWYLEAWRRYAEFDGRSRRKEYWAFQLGNTIIGTMLAFLMLGAAGVGGRWMGFGAVGLICLLSLAVIIPSLSVTVRRLHDTGRSGWWMLVSLVPFIGAIVLLVFLLQDSAPGPNEYGPNPKALIAPVAA